MKGGYQIIDLSSVTVGTQATISGIYDKVGGNNAKPIMIITPDSQRVFAEVKAGTNKYVTAYLGADGSTYTVEISNANAVNITKQESSSELDGRVDGLEERLNKATLDYTNAVDLTPYTAFNNCYTVLEDGYAIGSIPTGLTTNVIAIGNSEGGSLGCIQGLSGHSATFSVFVRKGIKICAHINVGSNNSARFVPLK